LHYITLDYITLDYITLDYITLAYITTVLLRLQEIRSRERQLVDELRNVYGPECMKYIDNRLDLAAQMETLRNTCKLTEHILDGKNIELLLLKNDVEEKLAALNDVTVHDLPASVDKVVTFVAGSVDMGYIYDMDRPLVSGPHAAKKINTQDQLDAEGANEAMYHNQVALHAALAELPARKGTPSISAVVTEATQTDKAEVQTVSRATQTDQPMTSPQPVKRVQPLYRKPEQSSFSKPARFG